MCGNLENRTNFFFFIQLVYFQITSLFPLKFAFVRFYLVDQLVMARYFAFTWLVNEMPDFRNTNLNKTKFIHQDSFQFWVRREQTLFIFQFRFCILSSNKILKFLKQEFNGFILKWLRIGKTQRTFWNPDYRIDPIKPHVHLAWQRKSERIP